MWKTHGNVFLGHLGQWPFYPKIALDHGGSFPIPFRIFDDYNQLQSNATSTMELFDKK